MDQAEESDRTEDPGSTHSGETPAADVGGQAPATRVPAGETRTAEWLDLVLTLFMALAAVGTAWAGFESTKWSGTQANSYAAAGAARTESNQKAIEANQDRTVDVITFTQWLTALDQEVLADPSARPTGVYRPAPGTVSGFLFTRFRAEFRPAVDAWVATRPLLNPNAPTTPFVMPQYRLAADADAIRLAQRADQFTIQAQTANERGDNYVLTAVIFAMVLFFAGVASRPRRQLMQRLLIGLATATLLAAFVILATFPVEF
jgi:hypothetical protein